MSAASNPNKRPADAAPPPVPAKRRRENDDAEELEDEDLDLLEEMEEDMRAENEEHDDDAEADDHGDGAGGDGGGDGGGGGGSALASGGMTISGEVGDLASMRALWQRDPVPALDPARTPLHVQSIDIDYYVDKATPGYPGAQVGEVPIVRVYGLTNEGHSVMVHVHGFSPYFYFDAPPGFDPPRHSPVVRKTLNDALMQRARAGDRDKASASGADLVLCVEPVEYRSIMHFTGNEKRKLLKITTAMPNHVPTLRNLLESGLDIGTGFSRRYQTYESNILFVLRFMVDCDLRGASWFTLPAGCYRTRPHAGKQAASRCQLEVDVAFNRIQPHAPEGEWQKVAPLRILSFDIECAGRKGIFPEANVDPVIQIASMLTIQGQSEPVFKNVMTLKSCAPIAGANVMSFENEGDLLSMWHQLVVDCDPDFLTGYNIINFDLPYLINRAKALNLNRFPFLGRIPTKRTQIKDTVFSSRQVGTRESKEINIEGRVQFDLLQVLQRDYKLRSYSLNSVSAHFLGEQKEDVAHSAISDLQAGDAQTRRRLAVYCLKDAYLPQRLLDKLMCVYNYTEMARVTGVPTTYLLTRGQQVKVLTQLYRKSRAEGMVIPCLRSAEKQTSASYEGATVIEPLKGFYNEPIATLDFASLYPSIMMAHNLCYSTLVPRHLVSQLRPDQYTRTPSGDVFVKTSVRKGLLPQILEELLSARKRAKADLKKADDPVTRAVLDGRQLALKVSANSVYGFTGATVGKLACLEIASSVTAFGREMIEKTKKCVEDKYNIANGYAHNAVVVYGDTDSVMVKFGTDKLDESMKLGKEAADVVTETFLKPIKLEFEKCYFPFLLMNKKRYAGMLWTNVEKWDKMDTKGLETVRRDNCPLVRNMMQTCLNKILIDRSVVDATAYAKQTIADLLQNKIDLSLLVVSKALTKSREAYDSKQAHVELAERMRKRDPGSAPAIGDRVAYVIIKAEKGAKGYEKSEDPLYVLEHNIPIDTEHYLEHHLKKPLMRIFEPIMDDAKSLFVGDHTRIVHKLTPSHGGMMKFAKKVAQCVNCKTTISGKGDEAVLCKYCKPLEADILTRKIDEASELEVLFSRLWTQCQRCQGNLHQEVLCAARDCPIFYMRKKVQKDLNQAQNTVARFNIDGW